MSELPGGLVIEELDPFDHVTLAAWHTTIDRARRAETGDAAVVWTLPELTATLRTPRAGRRASGYVGRLAGEVVVAGALEVPLLANLSSVDLAVDVAPEHRRRGHGSAMLAHLEGLAADLGRDRLNAEFSWPHDLGPDPAGTTGSAFATRHGYVFGLGDVQRELRGHVEDHLLDDLAAEAAPHHTAYELRAWSGPVPDDLLEGWLALDASLETEAPTGSLERELDTVDVGAHRDAEELLRRQGRTSWHCVALTRHTAEVVAYTQLVTTVHEPDRGFQWGTLVRRDHRGHRLGLAVKVATHQLLQARAPQVVRVSTWNAEENTAMIAVNERFGFVPVARLGELQKTLA